jgi:Domain of unknown function (DUF4936)
MRELFIYYRVRSEMAATVAVAVQRMQTQLRVEYPTLLARLLCRPGEDQGMQTWMETYAAPDGIGDALQARIATHAHALLPLFDGPRHSEAFVPCAC